MFLPYVRGVSKKLKKVCAPLGVKTIFRLQKKLRSMLMQVKQKTTMEKKRNVVYEGPFRDCQLTYIGETRRTMKKRMTEHKYAVKTGDPKNGIAVHVQKTQHLIDWGAGRVQATAIGYWNRRTMEAIHIRTTQSMCQLCLSLVLYIAIFVLIKKHLSWLSERNGYCGYGHMLGWITHKQQQDNPSNPNLCVKIRVCNCVYSPVTAFF